MMTYAQFEEMLGRAGIAHPEEVEEQWNQYLIEQQIEAEETEHLNSLGPIDAQEIGAEMAYEFHHNL